MPMECESNKRNSFGMNTGGYTTKRAPKSHKEVQHFTRLDSQLEIHLIARFEQDYKLKADPFFKQSFQQSGSQSTLQPLLALLLRVAAPHKSSQLSHAANIPNTSAQPCSSALAGEQRRPQAHQKKCRQTICNFRDQMFAKLFDLTGLQAFAKQIYKCPQMTESSGLYFVLKQHILSQYLLSYPRSMLGGGEFNLCRGEIEGEKKKHLICRDVLNDTKSLLLNAVLG